MDESEFVPHRSYLPAVWAAIASVGWYVLGILVALFFASPYLSEKYRNWKNRKDEKEYEEKYKKNPDLGAERLRSVEAARQRMQVKYDETVEKETQKKEAEKAEKMRELLRYKDDSGGHRLGGNESEPSTSNSKLNGYNPLMGDNTRRYKPPKRSGCRGGGCGGS